MMYIDITVYIYTHTCLLYIIHNDVPGPRGRGGGRGGLDTAPQGLPGSLFVYQYIYMIYIYTIYA